VVLIDEFSRPLFPDDLTKETISMHNGRLYDKAAAWI
jgi:hypothetical protein